jgi:HEAT repeats/PBS lyase HEAT-like repeat
MKKYAFLIVVLLLCFAGTVVADGIDGLIRQLDKGNPIERLTAAQELAKGKDPRAVTSLIKALKSDRNWNVRLAAEDALVALGSPSVAPLIQLLKEEHNCFIRRRAARALEEMKDIEDPSASEALVNAASKDVDCCVRRFAAMALAEISDPKVAEFLNNAMEKRDLEIISGAYPYYIRQGKPGTEGVLVQALRKFSCCKKMVFDLSCCDNEKLKQAAVEIAKDRKYTTPPDWSGPRWGRS